MLGDVISCWCFVGGFFIGFLGCRMIWVLVFVDGCLRSV